MCLSCGTTLTWKELIPLFSFAFQKGACKNCSSKISWQYPLVEFTAGLLFLLIFLNYPPLSASLTLATILQIFLACLLVVIAAYDIKHKIIPNQFVYIFDAIALLALFVGGFNWFHIPTLEALLAGPILALPFALLWLVSKGTWMGLGDAKLMLGLGWMLGINQGINALMISFWLAAGFSLVWLFVVHKKFKPRTEIPFGPYLILGAYLVLIFSVKVIDVDLIKVIFREYF